MTSYNLEVSFLIECNHLDVLSLLTPPRQVQTIVISQDTAGRRTILWKKYYPRFPLGNTHLNTHFQVSLPILVTFFLKIILLI